MAARRKELSRARIVAWGAGLLLVVSAVAYLLAAWRLPPGFYDGFSGGPSAVVPYKWVSPPSQFAHGNLPPQSGTQTVRVENGQVQPATMYTADGQVIVSWKLGSFDPPPGGQLTVQILPASSGYPSPAGLHLSTNVYQVKANAR